jgi:hypothetical protein
LTVKPICQAQAKILRFFKGVVVPRHLVEGEVCIPRFLEREVASERMGDAAILSNHPFGLSGLRIQPYQ